MYPDAMMVMQEIEEFTDDRLKGWCIHCGNPLSDKPSNRDHVPTRGLLNKPYPENVPVIPVCFPCNNGFSLDEEYFIAFLGCVLSGSTDSTRQKNAAVGRILARSPKLRELIQRACTEYKTVGGDLRQIWKPDEARINRVILKNARGHAFFEIGEPMMEKPSHVWGRPLTGFARSELEDFEDLTWAGWPEVGSRMMTRLLTGQDMDGPWVIVQDGVYRYSVAQGPMRVRSVIHEYLATEVCLED